MPLFGANRGRIGLCEGVIVVKQSKSVRLCLLVCLVLLALSGCAAEKVSEGESFARINAVCQMATLKCYYHNVAEYVRTADGWFGMGYKKLWIEYSGIVELGVNVAKVRIDPPDANGIVRVFVPDAEVQNVDFDMDSIADPITEAGFMTDITAADKTAAFGIAQAAMREAAAEDESLLLQAKTRAKMIVEGYIVNVGNELGKTYTVEWTEK